jgi:hypothetical protein
LKSDECVRFKGSAIRYIFLYFFVSAPVSLMMPAATNDWRNWSLDMSLTNANTFWYLPARLGFLAGLLAVTAIGSDVPEGEDVFWVPDADLDVCFFINPTPLPNPF